MGSLSHALQAGLSWAQFDIVLRITLQGENPFTRAFWFGDGSAENKDGVWGVFKMGFRLGPLLALFGNMGMRSTESVLGLGWRSILGGPTKWVESFVHGVTGRAEFRLEGYGFIQLLEYAGWEKAAVRLSQFLAKNAFGKNLVAHIFNPALNPLSFASSAWAVRHMVPLLS